MLDRIVAISRALRRSPLWAIALAVATFAAALGFRIAVHPYLGPVLPFITFFLALLLAGFFGGMGSGLLCMALSTAAAWWWFLPPGHSFELSHSNVLAVVFFWVVGGVNLALMHYLTVAVEDVSRKRQVAEELLQQQQVLFAELQHRVANNLAFVSALFGMQKRKFAANAEAVAAFDDARLRLDTMGRIHRRLYDPANAGLPLDVFLRELLTDMLSGASAENVRLDIVTEPIKLPVETTMTLALVVTEIATNSLKHAFQGRDGGLIGVRLQRVDAWTARLVVRDDGPGWPAEGAAPNGKSLGLRIIKSFATTLKAQIAYENDGGAVSILTFPVPDQT
jgi:two-component sensor histidine kinase